MTISKIDLISLVVLAVFAWRGYRKGAMNMVIGLVGLIASFLVPLLITPWLTERLMKISVVESTVLSLFGKIAADQTAALVTATKIFEMIVFVLLLIIMILIVGRIKKWIRKTNKLPVIGTLNRVVGACIGAAAAAMIVTAAVGGLYYFAQWTGNVNLQGNLLTSTALSLFLNVMN